MSKETENRQGQWKRPIPPQPLKQVHKYIARLDQSLKGNRKNTRDEAMMQQTIRRQICTYEPPMRLRIMFKQSVHGLSPGT